MQRDRIKYTLNYPIEKVWNKVYENRKKVVYRHEKLIEVWIKEEKKRIERRWGGRED